MNLKKKIKKLGVTFAIGTMIVSSLGTSVFADEVSTYALISKAFSGKNNIISSSVYTSGSRTFKTTDSQGGFSCRLTERFSGSSPDRIVKRHEANASSKVSLSGGTYYIRYEGSTNNAKTYATLN
ncbi:TPA: hypothetical protein KQC97_001806 [Clostridioides difficile]|uniref:hypothetical protein n=1 Tax=Clostridioides difficile TaxID=1496 RepID=UPI00097FF11D|nr:hypothetical protein [Clostridioides difficile]MDL5065455.1 hypothetical protein [Clostridioides difficile]MDN9454691.1 hypothetical protein [Clostridioides difficile]SJO83989.1 Uncharacterised protein [Clostridioides difficile]SJP38431.1 Uncharacterised protein [Clostridioides difficile]HBF5148580.1 hypothetical protein [Clostridioides difficile]